MFFDSLSRMRFDPIFWSFVEKTFVKQSMMCFRNFAQNGHKTGGNPSIMNLFVASHTWVVMYKLSSETGHAWVVTRKLSSETGHAWVVTRERPCRYKSTNLVFTLLRFLRYFWSYSCLDSKHVFMFYVFKPCFCKD